MTWRDLAECRGMGPALFYPAQGEPMDNAKAVCAECPVRAECLEDALANCEQWGVWGGLSERQRDRMRQRRRVT